MSSTHSIIKPTYISCSAVAKIRQLMENTSTNTQIEIQI